MKNKFLIFVSILSLFAFMNNVKADTINFDTFSSYEDTSHVYGYQFEMFYLPSSYSSSFVENNINYLISFFNSLNNSNLPYYFITINSYSSKISFNLNLLSFIPSNLSSFNDIILDKNYYSYSIIFDSNENKIDEGYYKEPFTSQVILLKDTGYNKNFYIPFGYYSSNFDLVFDSDDTYVVNKGNETLFTLNKGDIIPTYKNLNNIDSDNYMSIDLNKIAYAVLSLKDYSKKEEFVSTVKVKGQYCLTPVYNYGLTEKQDIIKGSKNQRCSPYYDDFTPVRTYILKQDLDNNAVYYLKANDTSKENIVKVDTTIFNVHLVSEQEKNNPIINVNGKNVSIKSYDELTDSATISEEEGFNSGTSCAVGDFNCTAAASGSFSFSDIFTSPIDFLKNVWSSIVKVFELVTMLIVLLPTPVQYFFYISFTLAIVLGLIKIIL